MKFSQTRHRWMYPLVLSKFQVFVATKLQGGEDRDSPRWLLLSGYPLQNLSYPPNSIVSHERIHVETYSDHIKITKYELILWCASNIKFQIKSPSQICGSCGGTFLLVLSTVGPVFYIGSVSSAYILFLFLYPEAAASFLTNRNLSPYANATATFRS